MDPFSGKPSGHCGGKSNRETRSTRTPIPLVDSTRAIAGGVRGAALRSAGEGKTPRLDADDIFFAVLADPAEADAADVVPGPQAVRRRRNHILPLFRGRCPRAVMDAADPYEAVTKCEVIPGASWWCLGRRAVPRSRARTTLPADRVEEICFGAEAEEGGV